MLKGKLKSSLIQRAAEQLDVAALRAAHTLVVVEWALEYIRCRAERRQHYMSQCQLLLLVWVARIEASAVL